ncbi:MAG: hypothetical protein ACREYF_00390, partial [Gammaproteobacteria bacterium]
MTHTRLIRPNSRPPIRGRRLASFLSPLLANVYLHYVRGAVDKRLREEFTKLGVEVNEAKSRTVDMDKGESFGFLGFEFRRTRSRSGRWIPLRTPQRKKRTALLRMLK